MSRLSEVSPAWTRVVVPGLCVLAFASRILGSLLSGHFLAYPQYYNIARTLVGGGGYCLAPGRYCAYYPPVYPTILAGCLLTGHFRQAVVIVSSVFAAGLVYLTWRIGARLFGCVTGMLAAAYCAIYPYYIWHDTVVQENVTLAFVAAVSLWCLLHATLSRRWAAAAGVALGFCVLTKANMLLFALIAPAWVWVGTKNVERAVIVYLAMLLTLAPWVIRTERLVGAPIIYSPAGLALFTANNAATFRYFPGRSIDNVHAPALAALSDEEKRDFAAQKDPNGILRSNWLWQRGMLYIKQHPWLSLIGGVRKIGIGFSPIFSPDKGLGQGAVYFASYFPILAGGLAGMWLTRGRWREFGYIYLLFASFAMGTAVFWAHTSHRVYLDPYLMIFAAYAMRYIWSLTYGRNRLPAARH